MELAQVRTARKRVMTGVKTGPDVAAAGQRTFAVAEDELFCLGLSIAVPAVRH
jgi:hypothetical protein